jgi:hypothetical protein
MALRGLSMVTFTTLMRRRSQRNCSQQASALLGWRGGYTAAGCDESAAANRKPCRRVPDHDFRGASDVCEIRS